MGRSFERVARREVAVGLHDQWYKNAVIYCLDIETFADSDGDGIGDLRGLISRLDYLAGLGVTCIWLMPCTPTPGRDDGYDPTDYVSIDPRLGTMADFAEFMVEARERGLHVLMDLVVNHTSNEHPWFQEARSDPESPYRDFYTWREDDPGDTSKQVVFPGEQEGIWTWDEKARAYYLHHFYSFQPELNFANPAVREEFRRAMGLWLQQGVTGFRIDAAPFLKSEFGQTRDDAHTYLRELEDFAAARSGNAILLGEVDEDLHTLADYFGGGNELRAIFNFPLNRYLFLALAQQSADPIKFAFNELPGIPGSGQWVNFLRHHDELNLARLTKVQRELICREFGPRPEMQVYNRGIRRRLAPMLGGNQARIRLAYSALFGLPGAPMLFYGEEIGMGENLALEGRLPVRTPMQWTDTGGFSTAPFEEWIRPPNQRGPYRPRAVNVRTQRGEPGSLLNWMAALIRARKECPEIGVGTPTIIDTGDDAVLGIRFDVEGSSIVVVNNFSAEPCEADLELSREEIASATTLFSDGKPDALRSSRLGLGPYGYRWLRIAGIY